MNGPFPSAPHRWHRRASCAAVDLLPILRFFDLQRFCVGRQSLRFAVQSAGMFTALPPDTSFFAAHAARSSLGNPSHRAFVGCFWRASSRAASACTEPRCEQRRHEKTRQIAEPTSNIARGSALVKPNSHERERGERSGRRKCPRQTSVRLLVHGFFRWARRRISHKRSHGSDAGCLTSVRCLTAGAVFRDRSTTERRLRCGDKPSAAFVSSALGTTDSAGGACASTSATLPAARAAAATPL